MTKETATPPDPRLGTVLGERFRLDAVVAVGGMSIVYSAVDLSTGEPVAVKVLLEEFESRDDLVHRFQREAKAAGALRHPNVVEVYECASDGGSIYIAMQLVPGETLRDHLRNHGPLAPEAAVRAFLPVLDALHQAHAIGIVHRDLKPENIILSSVGDDLHATILDFGIAKVMAVSKTRKTIQGVVLGTVPYMSPEQIMDSAGVGPSTDIWSIGVILYECLTGERPFRGHNATAIAAAILNGPPPSERTASGALPPALLEVLDRSTSRDLHDRYPDMACLSAGLAAAAERQGIAISGVRHCVDDAARARLTTLLSRPDVGAKSTMRARKVSREAAGPRGPDSARPPAPSVRPGERSRSDRPSAKPPAPTRPRLPASLLVAGAALWTVTAGFFFGLGYLWPRAPPEAHFVVEPDPPAAAAAATSLATAEPLEAAPPKPVDTPAPVIAEPRAVQADSAARRAPAPPPPEPPRPAAARAPRERPEDESGEATDPSAPHRVAPRLPRSIMPFD